MGNNKPVRDPDNMSFVDAKAEFDSEMWNINEDKRERENWEIEIVSLSRFYLLDLKVKYL